MTKLESDEIGNGTVLHTYNLSSASAKSTPTPSGGYYGVLCSYIRCWLIIGGRFGNVQDAVEVVNF